jgi:hypothetical protein
MTSIQNSESPRAEQPDFFVRPWMVRFLPDSIPRRDLVMCLVLYFVSFLMFLTAYKFELEKLAVAILSLGFGIPTWHYYERLIDRLKEKRKGKGNG